MAKPNYKLPLRRIAREWALQFLYQLDISGDKPEGEIRDWFLNEIIAQEERPLGEREIKKCSTQALATVNGVLQHLEEIDQQIHEQSKNWDIGRMAAVDRNILRLGIYEICYCDDIPAEVSINEALEIVKIFGGDQSVSFINGILDKVYKNHGN